jgi:hypothetical protein
MTNTHSHDNESTNQGEASTEGDYRRLLESYVEWLETHSTDAE